MTMTAPANSSVEAAAGPIGLPRGLIPWIVAAGAFISRHLGRPTASKVAQAIAGEDSRSQL